MCAKLQLHVLGGFDPLLIVMWEIISVPGGLKVRKYSIFFDFYLIDRPLGPIFISARYVV